LVWVASSGLRAKSSTMRRSTPVTRPELGLEGVVEAGGA
jgi:hypothetical protein